MQRTVGCENGMAGDRRAARTVEHDEHAVFGRHAGRGRRVIDVGELCAGLRIVRAAFDADRALADGGQHLVFRYRRADMGDAQPLQSGQGQDGRLDDSGRALGEPCIDVAAQVDDLQVGPAMQELGATAQRRGADDGALPEVGDAFDVARDQDVAGILARQEGGDDKPRRLGRRHVLHAVDRGIDPAREQCLLDLLDEQALAAGLVGRRQRRNRGGQSVAHQAGLGQSELAAARAEFQEGNRHGAALA